MSSPETLFSPKCILLCSGKRKSGKDFVTDYLKECLGDKAVIVRLVGQLKKGYAEAHGLDYKRLLSAADYKELHRVGMVKWAENMRYAILACL